MMFSSNACDLGVLEDAQARRQSFTTWGILALAVFVLLGMAEWSKRTAASETVTDPMVMKEAIKIAAARDSGVKGLRDSESGKRISDAGKNLSDLGVSAVKPAAAASVNVKVNENSGGEVPATSQARPSYAASPLRGAATEGFGDREANLQTSAGE